MALPEPGEQPRRPPQGGQPGGLVTLRGWEAGPPDVAHDLEWEPQVDDRDDPAPERPGAGAALLPAAVLGVDPGAAEPHREDNAEHEDREVGGLVQPEADEALPPVRASQVEQFDGQPDRDRGYDHSQQHGQDVRQPADRQEHQVRPAPGGGTAARAGTPAGPVAEATGLTRHVSFARNMAYACSAE